jgi:hypothetical protein
MKAAGFAARYKAEIFEASVRQMRECVVDHQMVDVVMRDAGLGAEKQGHAVDAPVYLIFVLIGDGIESGRCITLS